jgi:hypothetical protein
VAQERFYGRFRRAPVAYRRSEPVIPAAAWEYPVGSPQVMRLIVEKNPKLHASLKQRVV